MGRNNPSNTVPSSTSSSQNRNAAPMTVNTAQNAGQWNKQTQNMQLMNNAPTPSNMAAMQGLLTTMFAANPMQNQPPPTMIVPNADASNNVTNRLLNTRK